MTDPAQRAESVKNKNWSYDPHRSRDSVSPVCGIFDIEVRFFQETHITYFKTLSSKFSQNLFGMPHSSDILSVFHCCSYSKIDTWEIELHSGTMMSYTLNKAQLVVHRGTVELV